MVLCCTAQLYCVQLYNIYMLHVEVTAVPSSAVLYEAIYDSRTSHLQLYSCNVVRGENSLCLE